MPSRAVQVIKQSGDTSQLVKMNGERYVGVALDYSPGSRYALKWTIDNVLRENDHLIILVVNKDSILEGGQAALWESSGTRKILSLTFFYP